MSQHDESRAAAPGPSYYSRVELMDNYPPNTVVKDIHMYNQDVFVVFTELQGAAIARVWSKLSAIGKGADLSGDPTRLATKGEELLNLIESFDAGIPG